MIPGPLRTLTLMIRVPSISSAVAVKVGCLGVIVGVDDREGEGDGGEVVVRVAGTGEAQEANSNASDTNQKCGFFIA